MRIGIVGDQHWKEMLGYGQYFSDHRNTERKEIVDFIHKTLSDCDTIILMGDNLNSKNNPSSVIKDFVGFLEGFGNKTIYVLAGNHEKWGDGRSAIDFLEEINDKPWIPVIRKALKIGPLTLVPYISAQELGVDAVKDWDSELMKMIGQGRYLFIHHTISDTFTTANVSVNLFKSEPVLSRTALSKNFIRVFGSHIHSPSENGNVVVTGSVFANEAGDMQKYIYILNTETDIVETIQLPGRFIYSLENPTIKELMAIDAKHIVRMKIIKKMSKPYQDDMKKELERHEAYILIEEIPHERKKVHLDLNRNILEFNLDELLSEYAKQRDVDPVLLSSGLEMVK